MLQLRGGKRGGGLAVVMGKGLGQEEKVWEVVVFQFQKIIMARVVECARRWTPHQEGACTGPCLPNIALHAGWLFRMQDSAQYSQKVLSDNRARCCYAIIRQPSLELSGGFERRQLVSGETFIAARVTRRAACERRSFAPSCPSAVAQSGDQRRNLGTIQQGPNLP